MSVFLCRAAGVEGIVVEMREHCYLLSGGPEMRARNVLS